MYLIFEGEKSPSLFLRNIMPGPKPPFSNPTIEPQFYAPRQYRIGGLTLGSSTIVTTTVAHDYVVGQLVRILIPEFYGSRILNEQTGYVIAVPSTTQVTVNINSTNANAFIPSPTFSTQIPQILAVGDVNSGAINANGRINNTAYILGSFINVSPN